MEKEHCYIQLLFPNRHQSPYNRSAPLLTDEMIKEIKANPRLQASIYRSFDQMLAFWGLEREGNQVAVKSEPEGGDKHNVWNNGFDHNQQRITRVLQCLMDCGFTELATNFERALQKGRADNNHNESPYWKAAVGRDETMPERATYNRPRGS